MDTALYETHCPELMIDVLYGGLTEHGKQFADWEALDPFLSEALSRPPHTVPQMGVKMPDDASTTVFHGAGVGRPPFLLNQDNAWR